MKRILLILPVAAIALSGCIAYQPSPAVGQYGYTYDYQVPIGDGAVPPTYSAIREPRPTAVITEPAGAVVLDTPPSAPPTTPPIYSAIPDMTPNDRVIEKRTTVFVPQVQPQVVQEAAGAQPTAPAQQPAAAPQFVYPPSTVYSGSGGFPIVTNPPITNPPSTNPPSTNGLSGGGTNEANATNAFNVARGTNIVEAAGAQPTNNVPQRLDPAPRLPAQPTLAPGEDQPASSPTPNTVSPQGAQQRPPSGVPNPAPPQGLQKPTFAPAAAPAGQQQPPPPVSPQQPPPVQP